MVDEGLYARAHKQILDLLPTLKGETLSREQWYKVCNVHPTYNGHKHFRNALNMVLYNMSIVNKKPLIVKVSSGFKVVDDTLVPIDFKTAETSIFDLTWPFGIHNYCVLYPKNLAIVYGSKDAAKSATAFNIIRLNMNKGYRIGYFCSEMVAELRVRLSKAEGIELNDWNFEAYERSYDFNEVIIPNGLNLVDFLELGGDESEYYKGVALVRRIYDRLDGGVAIIFCQKNRGAELPKGGTGLLEKARIALSLDPGEVTLKVAKNWAEGVTSSPVGKKWTYKLVGGINIVNAQLSQS